MVITKDIKIKFVVTQGDLAYGAEVNFPSEMIHDLKVIMGLDLFEEMIDIAFEEVKPKLYRAIGEVYNKNALLDRQ